MCDLMDVESCWDYIDDISQGVRAPRAIRAPVRNGLEDSDIYVTPDPSY